MIAVKLHCATSTFLKTKNFHYHMMTSHKNGPFNAVENIMAKIQEAGFVVSLNKETHLTKEMAEQLYADHSNSEFFDQLTDMMSR